MTEKKRVVVLDGWRGLAVGFVILGHFFPLPGLEIARLGVEFFFLLSGRLMAQILIFEHARLPNFYWRRFSRVMPGLVVFLIVVFIVSLSGLFSPSKLEYISVLTMWSNYLFTFTGREPVFGHTWSLSIEEHSYILLGILAFLLHRSVRASLIASGGIVVICFANGVWMTWGKD